jgi:hypothetical protein
MQSGRDGDRENENLFLGAARVPEGDDAVNQRKQCKVAPNPNVAPRIDALTDLADQNAAGSNRLTGVHLDASVLSVGSAAISGGAATFLMSHD